MKMKLFIYFTAFIATVYGSGELTVVSYPKSISFKDHENLEQSLLTDIYCTAMGFSIAKGNSWSGMYILDPFHLPECVVTIVVDGVSDIGEIGHRFPLYTDEHEMATWEALQSRVKERFPFGENILARVNLDDGVESIKSIDNFNNLKSVDLQNIRYLNRAVKEDDAFLNDIAILNSIINIIEDGGVKSDSSPDVFWFVLSSLHGVTDLHGANSSTTLEARELLVGVLLRLSEAFSRAYSGNALVTVVTSDASHTRRMARSVATDSSKAADDKNLNLAKNYNADYPVIFNIILWFGVAMFFSLLAISIVIGNMDPGRDSIIYRMTSNRMKKDN